MLTPGSKQKNHPHPYLSGNFAPIQSVQPLTPCPFKGTIPEELAGGEYVRNGGNPITNELLSRDAHWFDGDGMLSGVAFQRTSAKGTIQPEFVNQYILTDVFLSTMYSPHLKTPILPSIATLVNPLTPLFTIIFRILRTLALVFLSHLPGSKHEIKKISVANTALLYHDGRALATCESGVPMHVRLPTLETVGWFDGKQSEGEDQALSTFGFGGSGILGFMKEWTTAHPRVDPKTSELILYHNTFVPPYVHYSIIPSTFGRPHEKISSALPTVVSTPVPGIRSAKMMHDFGVSSTYTIIMDLPLSLDPLNLMKNLPVVSYDPNGCSRFGIFPRYHPDRVCWFETNPCCIFHTANSWDSAMTSRVSGPPDTAVVNMLVCRLTSASLVFSAGALAAPVPISTIPNSQKEDEQCRLYFFQFNLPLTAKLAKSHDSLKENIIKHQWALSAIPFEFPSLRDSVSMSAAKYIYGCSVSDASFGAALGRAVKINSLVKMDVETLIKKGMSNPPTPISGCVDTRSLSRVLESTDPLDPIKVFKMPQGWYAQESRFVPRRDGISEDDGWLLSYVFDESQLDLTGNCKPGAKSELWIINARNMKDVVAKIYLPQRVPYGLHGNWFSKDQVQNQRPITRMRRLSIGLEKMDIESLFWKCWMAVRRWSEEILA